MAALENKHVRVYLDLADAFGSQGQDQLRDRFLVLAADAAREFKLDADAEVLRARLLEHNPHHLLKPFASFEEAMSSDDVRSYVEGLRKKYPYEESEQLLDEMRVHEPRLGPAEGDRESSAPHDRLPHAAGSAPSAALESDDAPDFGAVEHRRDDEPPVFRFQDEPARSDRELAMPPALPPTQEYRETIPIREEADDGDLSHPGHRSRPTDERRGLDPLEPAPPSPSPSLDLAPALGEEDLTAGSWVATTWIVVVSLAGVALAFYTFARPFLPEILEILGIAR